MAKQILLALLVCAFSTVAYFGIQFSRANTETSDLNDEVRNRAPGAFVRTPSGITHYELAGKPDQRTVVLVHGFSVPYYLFDPTFAALRQAGYRVLRYDLFGRGFSDRPHVKYDADFFDRQLTGLLAALRIEHPVDLIGSSMGGPLTATFASRHPAQVTTLSWFDPGYSEGGTLPFRLRAPLIGEYVMATEIAPSLPAGQLSDFLHPEFFGDWPGRYLPQTRIKGFRHALLSTIQNYVVTDWTSDYKSVGRSRIPVFLVWGKADRDVPFAFSEKIRKMVPQARFLAVEDAAHVPFLEHPEIVNPALLKFLADAHPPIG